MRVRNAFVRGYGMNHQARIGSAETVFPVDSIGPADSAGRSESSRRPILRVGRNAWRVEQADRLAILVDGEDYFRRLAQALGAARRSIRIVGWDFNPDIMLRPLDGDGETLGALLRRQVDENDDLELHVLIWAMGPIYSGRSLRLFRQAGWADHPRIHLRFDLRHAVRGSHHQKMVTIDDAVAFVGGIDLTAKRWDTREHAAHLPERTSPDGDPYGPVHDVQAFLSGPAARAVAELARRRWKRATKQDLAAVEDVPAFWPEDLEPEMRGCETAVVRAAPSLLGLRGRRETIRLTHDALAAARRHIYIETQYLASFGVGRTLARRLREPDGPEVAIVVTCSSRGIFEQFVMGHNRDRLIRRLARADRHGRLRVMYAVVPDGEGECEVLIHSKVLVVDDVFMRVGSSNLNNRSEGLDTECDIAVEARSAAERRAIAIFRDRLLGEHLDAAPDAVSDALGESGSLVAAIDRLNTRPRGLRAFPVDAKGGTSPLPGTGLLDPKQPYWPLQRVRDRVGAFATKLFGGVL